MHTSGRIHFLELDLIDRTQTFMKMRRRIHVSTPLTDMSEKFGKNPSPNHAGLLFVLRCSSGKPDHRRNSRREAVR
jgi:hypothetical protein